MKIVASVRDPKYIAVVGGPTVSKRTTPCWSCGRDIPAGTECYLAEKTCIIENQCRRVKVCLECGLEEIM